jgi:hypothetical protein
VLFCIALLSYWNRGKILTCQLVARGESIAAFIPDLESLIAEAIEEWKVPGLAVAVVRNEEVALVGAYGLHDVEAGLPVTTDTQFKHCESGGSVRAARKSIIFTCIPAGRFHESGLRQHCTGTFSHGGMTAVVGQDNDGQLTLTVGSQPTYKLRPHQIRTFVIVELEGFRVEFHLAPDGRVDGLIFHQPNGTFVAQRAIVASR